MEEKKALAKDIKITSSSETSPAELIREAVKGNADLTKLEKLLELQERWDAQQAKKSYNRDMVAVQKDIPTVSKNLTNPQTHSKYASLDIIIQKTKIIYTTHGFSISFYEGETQKPEHIRVCADVVHCLGHKETYFYDVPLDGKGLKGNVNMTAIHGKASSVSYGQRYLMCMIWNIPTGDDNDAQGSGVNGNGFISDDQAIFLKNLIEETKASVPKILKLAQAEKIEEILVSSYNKVIKAIEAWKATKS